MFCGIIALDAGRRMSPSLSGNCNHGYIGNSGEFKGAAGPRAGVHRRAGASRSAKAAPRAAAELDCIGPQRRSGIRVVAIAARRRSFRGSSAAGRSQTRASTRQTSLNGIQSGGKRRICARAPHGGVSDARLPVTTSRMDERFRRLFPIPSENSAPEPDRVV